MYELAEKLWPLDRSLSGSGVRETLSILSSEITNLTLKSFESGTVACDWMIPDEWNVEEAFIEGPDGKKYCDFVSNNLHLVGYSEPFSGILTKEELEKHLFSTPDQPDAIPYVTSYYERSWGFCIAHQERESLPDGDYKVVIRSSLTAGVLDYAEAFFQGDVDEEILFTTYICHPSMANNELSGPILAAALARFISSFDHHFSYRFLFLPETIGAIAYISENINRMKSSIIAGYVLTCVGDERAFSYMPSRNGQSLADRVALEVLGDLRITPTRYSWLDRGSDERQFCSPGVDLPVCSVMRSKYGEFPEYHTSLDALGTVVTRRGLQGSFDLYSSIIAKLESRRYPKSKYLCEPQLGRRGLKATLSHKNAGEVVTGLMDVLSYCDGTLSVEEISTKCGLSLREAQRIIRTLSQSGLIEGAS